MSKDTTVMATGMDGLEYVVIRARGAGVHVGYLKEYKNQEAVLLNSRRIWKWVKAATLSQLAMEGVKDPDGCRFAMVLPEIRITEVCEVIPCTELAKDNIEGVPEWKV